VSGARLHDALREVPVPDARRAEERGWRVVRAAFERREPTPVARGRPSRLAIAIGLAVLALALALTPAGAKVADIVHDVVEPGERNARPELTSLPTSGALLVTSPSGAWVASDDGTKRRLGGYGAAAWSPNGLFVAVAAGRELTAVEPDGTVHWSLPANQRVADPAWAPSGIRVAYRAGDSLRIVAGDGTGDRRLVRRVAPTPPAWEPTANRNILAFVGLDRRVHAVDVESGRTLWRSAPFIGGVQTLQWSSNGHLLVGAGSFFVILDDRGQAIAKAPTGRAEATALAPDGSAVAVARRIAGRSELTLVPASPRGPGSERELFAGPGRFTGLTWSPDGAWLLLGWRDADQWLFVRPADRKVVAVSGISRQFAPGTSGPVGFPRVTGWCCVAPQR
jgi:PQQ-like domain/WD40-like Beta Propeller Repeat